MLDLAKFIHEAIGIESPRAFIALFTAIGALLFFCLGWMVDRGYRVKIREGTRLSSTVNPTTKLSVGEPPGTSLNPPTPTPSASSHPSTVSIKTTADAMRPAEAAKYSEPSKTPKEGSVHIEQRSQGPSSPNIYQHSEGENSPNVVLNGEQALIHSVEIWIELDVPTSENVVSDRAASLGFQVPVALFDTQKTRYRFVNADYHFGDWEPKPFVHRYDFVSKPETPSQLIGKPIEAITGINALVINYASFLKDVGYHAPEGRARLGIMAFLNGIEVFMHESNAEIETLLRGQAVTDVDFRDTTRVYKEKIASSLSRH